ncbi:uncharacterized protein LOC131428503 [Malaya genurostris]|uniref:uncharacterized protein LOC131428503 n=1 Tax=Malaya genurostris TaxID=325434 RepID=UPI0026F3E70F|nr:uncharacterized protein LOC131428503 [Malaya genurostris]
MMQFRLDKFDSSQTSAGCQNTSQAVLFFLRAAYEESKLQKLEWSQWTEITTRFQYFDHWTKEQRRECFSRAKVRQFEADQIIFVEGRTSVNFVHLVLSGKCMVLQCLKLSRFSTKSGTVKYCLAEAQPVEDEVTQLRRRSSRLSELENSTLTADGRLTFPGTSLTVPNLYIAPVESSVSQMNYEYHFVDVSTYGCGSVFGVGEHMDDRTVVARDRVQCLLIPRYWLLQKPQNTNNVWTRVRIFLDQQQPSRERVFQWFLRELRWKKFRTQTKQTAGHLMGNPTGFRDVPFMCRLEESDDV